MEKGRWNLIKKAHHSSINDVPTEKSSHDEFQSFFEDLDFLWLHINGANMNPSSPSHRDQLLVLLTYYQTVMCTPVMCSRENLPVSRLSTSLVQIMLESNDIHVYTLASKCLCLCLASSDVERSNPLWYTGALKQCFSSLRSGSHVDKILDLFRHVFSKKFVSTHHAEQLIDVNAIEKLRIWSLQELMPSWRSLADDVINKYIIDASLAEQEDPALFCLFSLWSKLIKAHQNYIEGEDISLCEEDNFAPLHKDMFILVDVLSSHETLPYIFDKVCDVLNRTLLYGTGSDQFQYGTGQGWGFQVDLAAHILRGVQRGLLEKVPLHSGVRHFGGLSTQAFEDDIVERSSPDISQTMSFKTRANIKVGLNLRSFRKVTLLVTKACALITRSAAYAGISLSAVELVLDNLFGWAREVCPQVNNRHWIILVFGDQDDMLVEIMLCFLDIHTTIKWKPSRMPHGKNVSQSGMSPHEVFLHFLHHTSFDHTLLLDLLTSPETCFLLYLVRYLHYAHRTWSELEDLCLTWNSSMMENGTPCLVADAQVSTLQERHVLEVSHLNEGIAFFEDRIRDSGEKVSKNVSQQGTPLQNSLETDGNQSCIENSCKSRKEKGDGHTMISSLKIVDYSDDSISSDSGSEGNGDMAVTKSYSKSNDQDSSSREVQPEIDVAHSIKSETNSSHTGSLASLTSVTSELDTLSDLLDVGNETDTENSTLDRMMSVLIRLRLVIDRLDVKGIFPYNAAALRRVLCKTEALYEGEYL